MSLWIFFLFIIEGAWRRTVFDTRDRARIIERVRVKDGKMQTYLQQHVKNRVPGYVLVMFFSIVTTLFTKLANMSKVTQLSICVPTN